MKKIGLFGGTFDPPHVGHFHVAQAALAQLELDEVIFVPNNRNPLKQEELMTPANIRMDMVKLMIEGQTQMSVSDIEISRQGVSFAVETVQEFQFVQPAHYWFIMGSDALRTLTDWKQPERLTRIARLAVVLRPPDDEDRALRNLPDYAVDAVDWVRMPAESTNATNIRIRLMQNESCEDLLAPTVLAYIKEHKMFEISHGS